MDDCTCVQELRHREPHEDDHGAGDDVEHEVVRARDDGERHDRRHRDGERADSAVRRRLEEHDPEEQVPAGVQARKRGVLVRQGRRLEGAIPVRVLGHRVHDAGVGHPRGRHRDTREEEEADEPGDEHRIAEQDVPVVTPDVERDPAGGDHGPVAVHVHPVRER